MPKEGAAKDADILDKFCEEHGFCGWYYTSAKDNVNVEESAKYLVAKVGLQWQSQLNLVIYDLIDNTFLMSCLNLKTDTSETKDVRFGGVGQ